MKEIVRIPITQQIVSSVKESIMNGQFPVASKLPPEVKLCEMLCVSRSSVREALRVLQAEGYIKMEAGKGATVIDNQSHDYDTVRKWFSEFAPKLEDFTEVREALEPLCMKLAISKSTASELEELLRIHREFIEADKTHNVSLMAKDDEQFHTQLAIMSHNAVLVKMNELLSTELWKYRLMSISAQKNGLKTAAEHQAICDALAEKDSDKALKAILTHLNAVRSDVQSLS